MNLKALVYSILIVVLYSSCGTYEYLIEPDEDLTAKRIIQKMYRANGGEQWRRPQSLIMYGHGKFYRNGEMAVHEKHNMFRIYESDKKEAHNANGKVRIESYKDGKPIILVTFDGQNTYDQSGKLPQSDADERWASSFGFGVIRHALDDGYEVERRADTTVQDQDAFYIMVKDLKGGDTYFTIDKKKYRILSVAFDTPRGWHYRLYSEFFTKEKYKWVQPGRVRLYYNGVMSNEIFWEDFELDLPIEDKLFILP